MTKQEFMRGVAGEAEYGNPYEAPAGSEAVAEELEAEGMIIGIGEGLYELTSEGWEAYCW